MSGNRFGRMPSSSAYMDAFNTATQFGQAVTDANQTAQITALKQNLAKLGGDFNLLSRAVEEELLKMSHKISEEDSISVTDQLAWFMNGD
jgi:hypothetical protein|tara:strand:+ start:149 stop:418 length:270 start_codon:yes stop_codon:yes gene_type:complete